MLAITLFSGLCTLVGSMLLIYFDNNKKLVDFSISLGFGVLVSLILLEIAPESIELIGDNVKNINEVVLVLLLMFGGIILLKILDMFIPEHHGSNNLEHIGIMTFITLFIHNFLEGMAIYSTLSANVKMGTMLSLGVALHNIPLGMTIASFFSKEKNNKKMLILSTITSLSTFLGALLVYILKGALLSELALGIILALTLGMLVYIVLFELLPHIIENKNKKFTYIGIASGIVILIISLLFE